MAERATLDGYWLPEGARRAGGLFGDQELELQERALGPGHVPMRIPQFTPHTLRELLATLREKGGAALSERRVSEILGSVGMAAGRLTSPGEPLYEELLDTLPELTGYSRRMIEIGLERMGANWTSGALRTALEAEFGSLEVLDGFQLRPTGGYQRAFGPALTVHVFSGNIPGISVSSLVRALSVKSASFGKTAAGEPYLAVCFARALAEEDAELADSLAVSYWPGGSEDLEVVAFSEAGAVIAYGSDETIRDIGCRVPPVTRFISYPNRVSVALVTRRALSAKRVRELARGAALDVATFDQQGCVSPHTIYAEAGGAVGPLDFARHLGDALEELSREIPRGAMSPDESALIHQVRAHAETRGATILAGEQGTEWTVIVEEGPEFEPSPLNRVIRVCSVDDLSEATSALERLGAHLQTVAVAGEGDEVRSLAARLGAIGATRVVPVGEAAWPAPHWHHDGRFQFMDLVRFVDLEGS
jgi:hypothetical protein